MKKKDQQFYLVDLKILPEAMLPLHLKQKKIR